MKERQNVYVFADKGSVYRDPLKSFSYSFTAKGNYPNLLLQQQAELVIFHVEEDIWSRVRE